MSNRGRYLFASAALFTLVVSACNVELTPVLHEVGEAPPVDKTTVTLVTPSGATPLTRLAADALLTAGYEVYLSGDATYRVPGGATTVAASRVSGVRDTAVVVESKTHATPATLFVGDSTDLVAFVRGRLWHNSVASINLEMVDVATGRLYGVLSVGRGRLRLRDEDVVEALVAGLQRSSAPEPAVLTRGRIQRRL